MAKQLKRLAKSKEGKGREELRAFLGESLVIKEAPQKETVKKAAGLPWLKEGFFVLLVMLILVGVPLAIFAYNARVAARAGGERVFNVVARNPQGEGVWLVQGDSRWNFSNLEAPSEIRVKEGERVVLRLTAVAVKHYLTLPAFGIINKEVNPGKVTTISFQADKVGKFPFFCTLYCGTGHERMVGQVIVERASEYIPGGGN